MTQTALAHTSVLLSHVAGERAAGLQSRQAIVASSVVIPSGVRPFSIICATISGVLIRSRAVVASRNSANALPTALCGSSEDRLDPVSPFSLPCIINTELTRTTELKGSAAWSLHQNDRKASNGLGILL